MNTPQIVFGAAGLGQDFTTVESVQEVLTLLKDLKVSQIDTAARYPPINPGMSEKLLGSAHAASQGFSFGTKILMGPGDGSGELERSAIQKSLYGSLERLGVNQVDVLYIHRPDPRTPLKDQAAALDNEYKNGKFKRLGVSNFSPELLQDYIQLCDENGLVKPSVYQGDYNVITRGMEKTLLPLLRAQGMSYYAFRPLAAGFLTGKFTNGQYEDTRFSDTHAHGKFFQVLYGDLNLRQAMRNLEAVLEPLGISSREAGIRWICYHSQLGATDAIILGVSKLVQIKENLESVSVGPLPENVVQSIEDIWSALDESRGGIL